MIRVSFFSVSGGGLRGVLLGLLDHVHGMVCAGDSVWVFDGQSTSARCDCSVARVCAGRLFVGGMTDFQ